MIIISIIDKWGDKGMVRAIDVYLSGSTTRVDWRFK